MFPSRPLPAADAAPAAPLPHASTHGAGESDTITPESIGAAPKTRTFTAGYGLTGGGDFTANRSFAVDASVLASRDFVAGAYMPATLLYGTYFLPQHTGQLLNANDGTVTYTAYGQSGYAGQGSTLFKMRAKLSPTADPTQLSVGSSDGYYGAMEVWATGKGLYVHHGTNLTTPRSFWWMVDDVAMICNVPIDSRAGDVIVSGDEVTLALPVGKSTAVYEVVFTGNNGSDARYVLPAIITVTRSDAGVITGNMTPLPSWPLTPPGWVTEPELNDGVNSIVITLTDAGTWQTTVRTKALTSV